MATTGRIIALGEVLWDLFDTGKQLGGAPLNFCAHAHRLKHNVILISALANDGLGNEARNSIAALGLDTRFIQTTANYPTGTVAVRVGPAGQPAFAIHRPAAYDAVELSRSQLDEIAGWSPGWLYYGTLCSFTSRPPSTLARLSDALPQARRFYDVNLRPDSYSPQLVRDLLAMADVVKLNHQEMETMGEFCGLPTGEIEAFCRLGADRYGWQAIGVTLGERGCAIWIGGEYERVEGFPVEVADTVGAGDAFAAAFLHGLIQRWRPREIGEFANRVGAIVASRPGGIPEWSLEEVLAMAR